MSLRSRWLMQLFVTGGSESAARSARLASGFATRSSATCASSGGRLSRPIARILSICAVRAVAVDAAVDRVAHVLLHLRRHDLHRGGGRAERRQKVLDGLGLLEVDDVVAGAERVLRREPHLQQDRERLAGDVLVVGHELKVVALRRVRDAPAGEERAAQEGRPAALVLENAEVDVMGEGAGCVVAVGGEDRGDLLRVGHQEDGLAAAPAAADGVERKGERPLPELRQTLRERGGGGDDADFARGEAVGVEQHAVGLRLRAAGPVQRRPAKLRFDCRRK